MAAHPDPRGNLAHAHDLLSRAAAAHARGDDALPLLERATTDHPHLAEAWRALGDLHHARDDTGAADRAHARAIVEAVYDPLLRHAANALARHDLPVAERLLKPHLAEHPTDVAAMRMLAELAGRLGRNADAENLLRRALELAPGFAPARYNLAIVLHRQHRAPDALIELDRLLEAEPDNPAYRNLMGAVLGGIGAYDAALGAFRQALDGRPDNPTMWMSYGHTLKTLGRRDDSIAAYRRSIALRPALGEAWWSLANLKTVKLEAADIAAMEAALAGDGLSPDDRFHLHFALGKAYEDAADWGASFGHYADGNRLRRQRLDYDPNETHALVERSRVLFTPDFLAAREGQGASDPAPIFILGMPRSGSTLVEQILASHSMVEGTRELPDIQAIAHRLSGRTLRSDPSLYPEALADLSPEQLRTLGEDYLARTRIHRKTDRPFFIDKMPNNWAHIGLIRLILPNATIIDTRRHPLACCFSNFKQHFARGQAFTYALDDLGHYYADYVAMMQHFDDLQPGRIHRIFHEDMVRDTEGQVRALLDACGLPFEPATLRFWQTERAVQTASSEQVRRPIFSDGLDQWRHFAPWLGPLETALGDALGYP
ncbi:tetratricopeptide repeat-containing sulfotransferase family protein [Sphingomonas nostoxanthinifaciens]|uniref:tetratricopeptide repeat-containing sulfotransferase family protein n=1 Tax=Sphingomonas nostoxanthinifaciens TaxID=2872652 RepID=UPI001CC1D86D|nr:tetratricopeptide repeat-containing sulfotransferase family protein [Sphingomonas nostoxanthinifaciens]UAK23376.1 sulfotransferase [Sphingomonas nostoxanthinifaciens]